MAFTPTPIPIVSSVRSPYGPSSAPASCTTRPAILAAVAERAALRAQRIAEDSEEKRAAWLAELAALRPPPLPKIPPKPMRLKWLEMMIKKDEPDVVPDIWEKVRPGGFAAQVPKVEVTLPKVEKVVAPEPPKAAPKPVAETPAVKKKKAESTRSSAQSIAPVSKKKVEATSSPPHPVASVSKKVEVTSSSPQPVAPVSKKKVEATSSPPQPVASVSKKVEATSTPAQPKAPVSIDTPIPTPKSPSPTATASSSRKSPPKSQVSTAAAAPKQEKNVVASSPPPQAAVSSPPEKIAVEEVATPSGTGSTVLDVGLQDNVTKSNGVTKKDIPSNVMDAVNGGKLKALTVTKLRRMLSDCGLKTSGRKSELIARLTSYVRK